MISVILINYNTLELTRACIRSIKRTYSGPLEIIVIDNASKENNVQALESEFQGLILHRNTENLGFSKANNQGIKLASGDHILLLNTDTELQNNAIDICKDILQRDPCVGVVSAQLLFPDQKIQHCCQAFPNLFNEILEITRLHKLLPKTKSSQRFLGAFFDHKTSCHSQWVWGTFFMFRKKDLLKLPEGKLSELFFMYGEDMEWCYQFKEAGLSTYYAAEAKVLHLLGASGFGEKKDRTIIHNELVFVKMYHGSAFLFFYRILKRLKFRILSLNNRNFTETARLYREL